MKTTLIQKPRLLALLGLVMTLSACGETVNDSDKDNVSLPVIAAKIGDTWDEVIQNSTFKLGPTPSPAGTIINQPHTFVYRDQHHRMQLDNVGYTGVALQYFTHHVLGFGIGVYRESAGVDETWERLQDIIQKMEMAGWIPDDESNNSNPSAKSAAELRSQYLNLPGGARGGEKFWYDEYGNEAWVSLVKTITGRNPGEEPRFNVVLQIQVATNPKKLKAAP
ncbi:MAG: hypothetical protein LBJ37_23100 [Paucimonas sp.]|jgi:hypothetical protein|nr:hypothetical protein [Paucimonas sp.]